VPNQTRKIDPIVDAEDRFIDAVGAAIEFWGFKRILGHTWAFLYLAGEPRDAAAIVKRLKVSKAAVSTALGELENWGCVHRFKRPGERRELFEAEQDVWAMVTRVFRNRELPRIQKTIDSFERVRAALGEAKGPSKDAARGMDERVERLAGFALIAVEMMKSALDQGIPGGAQAGKG